MGKRWLASADGSNKKYSVETDATIGADIGVNLRLDGQVLSLSQLKAILGTVSTRVVAGSGTPSQGGGVLPPGGDLTTDMVIEGRSNLYFTDERAQDAVGSILLDSANVTLDYVDATPSIQADLTDTGVTAGTYGDATHVARITVDAKGRITAISLVAITGGGGGSPLTTKGDIFTFSTVDARFPVGSNGQVIFADSTAATGLVWENPLWLPTAGGTLTGDVTGTNFTVGAGGNFGGGGFFTSPTRGYVLRTIVAGVPGGFFRIGPDGSTATKVEFRIDNTSNDSFANVAYAVNVDGSTDMLLRFMAASGVAFSGKVTPSISGTLNDWSPTGLVVNSLTAASAIIATLTATANLTGIAAAQVDGTLLTISNQSAFTLTLLNGNVGSTAANRFQFPADVALAQYASVRLRYNGGSSRWNIDGTAGPAGPTGPTARREIRLSGDVLSSKFDSFTKRVIGSEYIDPTLAGWGTNGSSTITLCMLLETTNAAITVQGDLYQETGTGSPQIIASTSATASLTATLVTANVSAAFRPTTGVAGIYTARIWITTANGTDQVTCAGAWLEVQP